MSEDIYGLTDISNITKVIEIRQKFLSETQTNPQLYHEIDVERVHREDWQVERFVLDYESVDKAYEALVKAMRWKKSYGVHDRSHSYFPKEFLHIFGYEAFSRDREGRVVRWGVSRYYKKMTDFAQLVNQFTAYTCEMHDRLAGNKGTVLVSHVKGTGMFEADISGMKFSIEMIQYYPPGPQLGLIVDLPPVLSGVFKLILSLSPKRLRSRGHVITSHELTEYIEVEEIPVTFGGKRETVYTHIDQMSALHECKHLGFSDKQIDDFYKTYKHLFRRQ